MSDLKYLIVGFIIGVIVYFTYKKIKQKIMIRKDYNRKVSKDDLKIRKDLQVLRDQLFKYEDPAINNEILNKIQTIVNTNNKGKEDHDN